MKEELLIITGIAGAGKSTAINFFEDRGYLAIDNLPVIFLPKLCETYTENKKKVPKLAVVIDFRSWENMGEVYEAFNELKKLGISYKILFLDAKSEVIINRYNLTRRKHPIREFGTLNEKVTEEKKRLEELRLMANFVIDTSELTAKGLLKSLESFSDSGEKQLTLSIFSFGFKYGLPIAMDLLFDVRFLPNPYYIEELKEKTGNDKEVSDYVMSFGESTEFFDRLTGMLDYLIPKYIKEGKSHLTIGIACSGGKHRSVTFVNGLYDYYKKSHDFEVIKHHRDIDK